MQMPGYKLKTNTIRVFFQYKSTVVTVHTPVLTKQWRIQVF